MLSNAYLAAALPSQQSTAAEMPQNKAAHRQTAERL